MGGETRTLRRHRPRARERSKRWMWPRGDYDRGEAALAIALSECLDEMQMNGGDVEAALVRYPELAADILPLLEVAAMLRRPKT